MDAIALQARRDAAKIAPLWTGDLADDCSAQWAGFMLRAEKMKEGSWWYSVRDVASGLTVEDSTAMEVEIRDGGAARMRCEEAARRFLSVAQK